MTDGLAALTAEVHRDLARLAMPARNWVTARPAPPGTEAHDVVIIGGGQSGLGAAFGLLREGVGDVLVLDENPAGREGPWATYARMATLRTPKHLTGIDFGLPSLTFQSWWEAQHGAAGWAALDKIPRGEWMRYLVWYRETLALPVRNAARATAVTAEPGGGFRIAIDGAPPIVARKVILATGIQGGGEWHVPAFLRNALPPQLYAHTSQAIDFAALAGKRIGILGGGASAFDNAHFALQSGVGSVDLFVRRPALPRINPIRHMEQSGFIRCFAALDDDAKYRAIAHFFFRAQPPTNDMFARAASFPNFALHLGAPWTAAREENGRAVVATPQGEHAFDFLIVSTGLLSDLALRPELAALAGDIALWRDRFTPPAAIANPLIDAHPYLGPGFEALSRTPDAAARLHGLYLFNYAALASLGLSAAALSGLKVALPKLVGSVSHQLFADDSADKLAALIAYDEPEFTG